MGRTEELRALFRKRAEERRPDPGLVALLDEVNRRIEVKRAFVAGFQNPWLLSLFEASRAVPAAELSRWVEAQVKDLFVSAGDPPDWVFEPTWCFHDDQPMIFVGQIPDRSDGGDQIVYLFAGRVPVEDVKRGTTGWRRIYKTIVQGERWEVVTEGFISG